MNQIYNHALAAGTQIESYEIRDVLGVGGFGITYRAYDSTLEQVVAIKEYLPDGLAYRLPDNQTLTHKSQSDVDYYKYGLQRFLDEARTLARFRDPSIVRVVRFIEANGTAYLVMDFEQGEPLSQRLRKGPMRESAVRQLLRPLLLGLRSVHAQGFLHRDVKPSNILLRSEGPPVLLDFGAARHALGEQTKALTTMVTPGYAPFEQYYSKDRQGPWTDLYGLGATLYHCLTGRAPAAATERIAAAYDHESDPADARLAILENEYSQDLLDAVRWMLKPHAKDRPQTVDAMIERLQLESAPAADNNTDAYAELNAAPVVPPPDQVPAEPLPADVLNTVHANLEEHIGPMAKALVHKAGRQVSSIGQLTDLLARFIPSEDDKTQFLGKTRMLGRPTGAAAAEPKTQPTAPPPPITSGSEVETVAVTEDTIQFAKQCLAGQVGPIAGMLVRKAAKRASDPEDFVRRLAAELNDSTQRTQFLQQMKSKS